MINLLDAAVELQSFLEKNNKPFCFIGGIAVLQWGEVRITNDLDLALLCGYGKEENLIDFLLDSFSSRISDAKNFALTHRVLLLKSRYNVPIDITLSGLDFEERMIQKSSNYSFMPGYNLKICSLEDLIVMKAFANRPKDWMDIEGIVLKQGDKINKRILLTELAPLAAVKEDPTIFENLNKLLHFD